MSKKTTMIIGSAAAAALLAGGGGTAFALSHEAQISVYGETSTVRSFNNDVESLLKAQGVQLKPTDLVTPALSTPLTNGIKITVEERQEVTVTVDGKSTDVLTAGDSVADALSGFEFDAEKATITPAPDTPLADVSEVTVVTPKKVTFKGQYGQDSWTINAVTVGEAAEQLLGDFTDADTLNPARDTLLEDGMVVTVTRNRSGERTVTEEIPFSTRTEKSDDLYVGESKVKAEGKPGAKEKVIKETKIDGKVTKSEVVSEKVTAKPQDRVVVEGTKERPSSSPSSQPSQERQESTSGSTDRDERDDRGEKKSSSERSEEKESSRSAERRSEKPTPKAPAAPSGGVWDRLAQCESGGNWSINTGNGFYGGLQFTHSTWLGFGGGKYANNAHQATRSQQIEIAKKVQAAQGWGAWPACTAKLGIR